MVKFINILFVVTLLFSCKKEVVYVPSYLNEDISFMQGNWEWKMSTISFSTSGFGGYIGGSKDFVYKSNEPSIFCTLSFISNKVLEISSSSGYKSYELHLTGLRKIGDNSIVSFRNKENELIRFTYIPSSNEIETEFSLLTFSGHECNNGFNILTSHYEKI